MVLTVLFTFKFKLRIYDRDGRGNGVLAVTAFERDRAATSDCRDCRFWGGSRELWRNFFVEEEASFEKSSRLFNLVMSTKSAHLMCLDVGSSSCVANETKSRLFTRRRGKHRKPKLPSSRSLWDVLAVCMTRISSTRHFIYFWLLTFVCVCIISVFQHHFGWGNNEKRFQFPCRSQKRGFMETL